ncbi:MAG: hypothetical protein RLZZ385_2135 [Pseudomonadota bacterium]|jgi:putative heme-binding domain-containing protein
MSVPKPAWWQALMLLVPVLLSTQVAAEDTGNLFNTPMDVRAGETYFQRQCSRCHGQDARGNDETGAPNLTGRLNRASTDAGIFTILREGIAGTAMLPVPGDTPDSTVWQLVAFINSLRSDPANIQLPGNGTAGRNLFSGKGDCARCHMIDGEGGRLGPDLSVIGEQRDPDELLSALIDPDAEVLPRWWTVQATLPDGRQVRGLRMDEDTFTLRIMDEDANLWSFRKQETREFQRITTSTMPNYAQRLTSAELDDLVAYLFSLRRAN